MLLAGSCSFSHYQDYQRIPITAVDRSIIVPWFQGETNRFLFRTHVELYRNQLGGLMLIKSAGGNGYRVLFMTEIGIKIFDMEFSGNGDFKLHYCVDALKRKSVIETLKNDIGLLVSPFPENSRMKMMKDRNTGDILIKTKDSTGIKYYFLKESCSVNKIIQKRGWNKKADIAIFSADSREIDSIRILHSPIKLNIYLSKLNENSSEVSE
jgi:hypothetical protein